MVTNAAMSTWADAATSSTARSKAARFASEGLLNPLSFLTNWSEAARISWSVAGGLKLNRVLMFLHMSATYIRMPGRLCSAPIIYAQLSNTCRSQMAPTSHQCRHTETRAVAGCNRALNARLRFDMRDSRTLE